MSEDPIYEVSILEMDDGWEARRTLLRTRDRAEADGLYQSLIADGGVRARIDEIRLRKKR
jgi:hypothetical protein